MDYPFGIIGQINFYPCDKESNRARRIDNELL
jgi:hypothetical protein